MMSPVRAHKEPPRVRLNQPGPKFMSVLLLFALPRLQHGLRVLRPGHVLEFVKSIAGETIYFVHSAETAQARGAPRLHTPGAPERWNPLATARDLAEAVGTAAGGAEFCYNGSASLLAARNFAISGGHRCCRLEMLCKRWAPLLAARVFA